MRKACFMIFLFGTLAGAQTFEVASVRPANRDAQRITKRGGPGTTDPTHLTFENYPLIGLIAQAYDLPDFRLTYPGWMFGVRFNVVANVPAGATKQDMRVMLQHLLAERFKLRVHRQNKEMQVLELTVAKNGPKFKDAPETPVTQDEKPASPPAGRSKTDEQGFPVLAAGSLMAIEGDMARMHYARMSMSELAGQLTTQLGSPVVDATGLKGAYDITLSWNTRLTTGAPRADGSDVGPTLTEALQQQLGLKVQSKKMSIEMLVVDNAERVPTEN